MTNLVDLPNIEFVSNDADTVLKDMVTVYEGLTSRTLYPADPVRLFLQSIAAIIVQQRTLINLTAKSNYLRYAHRDVLRHMGALVNTPEIPSQPATTTIRYTLSQVQKFAIPIPVGTRVGTQGQDTIQFVTTDYSEIPAGAGYVDVRVLCTVAGANGNGLLPGQINVMVDPVPYVQSVSNITTSAAGTDEETDDHYRERIRIAPESFSVAGPAGAYEYWAKTASSDIIDVAVLSPSAGIVSVIPLMKNGEIPSNEVLSAVEEILNEDSIRPLTDLVMVNRPTQVGYSVELMYYINKSNIADIAVIQNSVARAIDEYVIWQKSKLGRNINPSELTRKIMQAGAYRVDIISPVQTAIDRTAVAIADNIEASYGGVVDD